VVRIIDSHAGAEDVAQPAIRCYAQLVDKDGNAVGDPETGPPTFGGNWIDSEELNGFEISDGSPPLPTTRWSSTRKARPTRITGSVTRRRCS
jgi:hypothetical protein